MSSFYEKYLQLCVAHGEKPTAVAKKIGLSNAAPSGWKKGKAPSDATRQSIAAYFEIPVDALDEDPAQKEKPAPGEGSGLDARAKAILDKYNMLDPATQAMFESMLDAAIASQEKKNGH
nr:MAG TPA: nucleoid-associated protein [Caudoviricetes sp.]